MKNLIVYHQAKPGTDCPDGICSAWITSKSFNHSNFELIGETYLNNEKYSDPLYALPYNPENKNVYLLDFSYPRHILKMISCSAKSLTVLDHHKTRMADISAVVDLILGGYNENECGATFAWKHFFCGTPQPWFLKHVRRRDIGADGYYEGETPESEAVGLVMSELRCGKVGKEAFPVFDRLCQMSESEVIKEGMPKIEERNLICQQAVDAAVKANRTYQIGDRLVPLIWVPKTVARHYSVIGAMYCRQHQLVPFVVLRIEGDEFAIHLRSRKGGADVSKIAVSMGGGGHVNTAGYQEIGFKASSFQGDFLPK